MKSKFYLSLVGFMALSALSSCSLQGPQGERGPQGEKGSDGEVGLPGSDGKDGVDGKDGEDGSKIYTGTGKPFSNVGNPGDIYIDVDSGDIYSKGTEWVKTGNIKGGKGDQGDAGKDGLDGKDGEDGVSIIGVSKTSSSGNIDVYTISYSDGSSSSFTVTNGADGQPGAKGEKGEDGHTPTITIGSNGNWFVDGEDTGFAAKGPKGDQGTAGNDGKDGTSILSVVRTSGDGAPGTFDTYTIYYSDGSTSCFTVYNGKNGADGVDGKDGHTPNVTIGDDGYWYVDGVNTNVKAEAEDGKGISNISKTSSEEGVDTYTITYSDGSVSFFHVTNGKDGKDGKTPYIGDDGYWYVDGENTGVKAQGDQGVQGEKGDRGEDGRSVGSIEPTSTSADGLSVTYTITYSDGTTSTFVVSNGKDGEDGKPGEQGIQGEPGADGHTPVITVGSNGNWFVDGLDSGVSAKGEKGDQGVQGEKGDRGEDGADGKDGISVVNAEIDENGHLICTMSDGSIIDAGIVKDVTKHTVNFHFGETIVESLLVEHGSLLPKPERSCISDGYELMGWYLPQAYGSSVFGHEWIFGAYTVLSDLDLYADYYAKTYTIHYSATNPSTGEAISNLGDGGATYGEIYVLYSLPQIDEWRFDGWETSDGVPFDLSGTYLLTSDVTLIAKWSSNYEITLDPNGGTMNGSTENAVKCLTYGQSYTLPIPSMDGYKFLGWYDTDGNVVASDGSWAIAKDVTLTAKWEGAELTYELDAGGGVCPSDAITVSYGSSYELPIPTYETSDGSTYFFMGWYLDDEKVEESGSAWLYSKKNGTLKAKYSGYINETTKIVSYGMYPQTYVSDDSVVDSLNAMNKPTLNDWYLLDGNYYAKCEAAPFERYTFTFADGTSIVKGQTYWFKVEPILWNIKSSSNGSYFLITKSGLEYGNFNEKYRGANSDGYYANNYEQSEIRQWLNGAFYDSAFVFDDALIQTTKVDNSKTSISTKEDYENDYCCNDTEDKVFLPSFYEVGSLGLNKEPLRYTDWAFANGAYGDQTGGNDFMTRSPNEGRSTNIYYFVGNSGISSSETVDEGYGIRPCINLRVK